MTRKIFLTSIMIFVFAISTFLPAAICPSSALAAVINGTITVTSPAGGDVLTAGSSHTITWDYMGNLGAKVNIALYKGGNTRSVMKLGAPIGSGGSGSYAWKIPAGVPDGNDYQVKILCASKTGIYAFSDTFTVKRTGSSQQQNPPGQAQNNQLKKVLINDSSFVTLTAVQNSGAQDYKLQVKANDSAYPVEVSYLVLNPNGTPMSPSHGVNVNALTEAESSWGGSAQYFGHTEVGGWALPQYQTNPQSFALPHYRTCVMMLARYEKIYVIFLRENDGQLTYQVYTGGAFNGLTVPALATVTRAGDNFQIHSQGGAVEVGIWDKGNYKHDEVTGWAQANYQANHKLYPIPKYGMFMLMVGRYDKMGLILGNYNDGKLGTICFSGSKLMGTEIVPGLGTVSNGGSSGNMPQLSVKASGKDPVEVSHFSFDNTCWQWEVGGWAKADYKVNPQTFPLKHYTPGFFMCSRYNKSGIFFYNENDSKMGILRLSSSTQVKAQQNQGNAGQPSAVSPKIVIKVLLNGHLLSFDQQPVIINGSTLVPMRAIFEALGAEVSWDSANQTVTGSREGIIITLVIGSSAANKSGQTITLSEPAQLIGGRTMVPLRFVAEAMQAQVNWNDSTKTISIVQGDSGGNNGNQSMQSGKQTVEQFFNDLGSGNVTGALTLMDKEMLGSASTQEMWKHSFNSFAGVDINSIEEANKSEWTNELQVYKVVISVSIKPGTQSMEWEAGSNTRWASVKLVNGYWKLLGLATGP